MGRFAADRKKQKRPLLWLGLGAAVIAVLALLAAPRFVYLFRNRPLLRTGDALDLRAEALSVSEYDALASELPQREILWMVPIGTEVYDSSARQLTVGALTKADIPLFRYLPLLETVDARSCPDHAALIVLQQAYPQLEVRWNIHLGGQAWALDTDSLPLEGIPVTHSELMDTLGFFAPGTQVRLDRNLLTVEELLSVRQAFPELLIFWNVELMGQTWSTQASQLTFMDQQVDTAALIAAAGQFSAVDSIHMGEGLYPLEELTALRQAYEGASVTGKFTIYGVEAGPDTQLLDLSGIPLTDTEALEQALALLPELTKVDMCDCGLSNEEMDDLCQRNPGIKFVWKVKIGRATIRTDITGFIGAKYGYMPDARIRDPKRDRAQRLFNEDCENFKYCTDMVVMDLGHMGVTDYSFLAHMPNLQYLILADTQGTDFSVLEKLDKLIYLELFMTKFSQTELLLNLKNLACLNLGDCQLEKPELLQQMTWLKMLWLPGTELSQDMYDDIEAALPDTNVSYYAKNAFDFTGNGWRSSQYYYDMRDLLGMYYLT